VLLALLLALSPAIADPAAEAPAAEARTGPTEVMLLYGDVGSTVEVAGQKTKIPANIKLPMGTHRVRITTSSGQLVVKIIEVGPPSEQAQVIKLSEAPAASVPGHTYRFVVPGGGEGLVIFVDGIEGGPPPLEVLLSAGEHTVEIQKPDGTKSGGPMTLEPKGEAPTEVSLKP